MTGTPAEGEALRFHLLGPLRAWRGTEEVDLGPGKQRAVLGVLLLDANRSVPVSRIVDAVWGDEPPENGANVVQKYVAGLRRALEPNRSPRSPGRTLTLTDAGYRLHTTAGSIDTDLLLDRVRRASEARTAGDLAGAARLLREALDAWRDPAFAGLRGAVFDAARDRLAEQRAGACELWAQTELDLGRHDQLVPELTRLVDEFPVREQLRYLLMLALYRSGRQAEALQAFRDARQYLVDEFGVEPGGQLRQLQRRILDNDPGLAAPPATAAPASRSPQPTVSPPRPPSTGRPLVAPGYPHPHPAAPPFPPGAVPSYPVAPPRGPVPAAYRPMPPGLAVPPLAPWAGSFRPPAQPAARRPGWWAPLARILLVLACVASLGTASWAVLAYHAVRRHSVLLAASAVGYLVIAVAAFALIPAPNHGYGTRGTIGLFCLLIAMFGGAAHVALLGLLPQPALDPSSRAEVEWQVRRQQALQLVHQRPDIARQLAIGRPDLGGSFDHGGLIDVNGVPEYVLAALPGLTPDSARRIVADRARHGPYPAVEELVVRGVLPWAVVEPLREMLIALPPDPAGPPRSVAGPPGP